MNKIEKILVILSVIFLVVGIYFYIESKLNPEEVSNTNQNWIKMLENENDSLSKENKTLKDQRTILYQEISKLEDSLQKPIKRRKESIKHTNEEVKRFYSADVITKLAIGDSIIRSRKEARARLSQGIN